MKSIKPNKKIKITLISLPLIGQKGDIFGNIPSIPVAVPYLASYLRENHLDVNIVDAFGLAPSKVKQFKQKYMIAGLDVKETAEKVPLDSDIIGISVHSGMGHMFCSELISELKKKNEDFIFIAGGAQPTTNYEEFIKFGADFVVLGEGEESFFKLVQSLQGQGKLEEIDGIAYGDKVNPKKNFIKDIDQLPFPAIDLLPLQNYWDLGYAHGPVKGKYTFLITSRGCPYGCKFCAAPFLWQRRWRARSAKNVVDEMETFYNKYCITDFHIQDDNFTVNKQRVVDICKEIINRKLKIRWQLPAGTKIETYNEEMLEWMAKSGCKYISFSPESGSKKVLKLMDKPFDFAHADKMVKKMNKLGIIKQACIVLGFPGELKEDRKETLKLLRHYTRLGVDEFVITIMAPLPGAEVYDKFKKGDNFENYEDLSFSPTWRKEYKQLHKFRMYMYLNFFILKMIFHPIKFIKQIPNILLKKFDTKIEMAVYRFFKTMIFK